jgi:hypothetical protein
MAITKIKTTSSFTNLTKYDSFLAGNAAYSPGAYESIATVTGNGSATTLTFSSIPSTYVSLQIRGIANDGVGNGFLAALRFNADSGTNYVFHRLLGNGSSVSITASASQTSMQIGNSGNVADTYTTYIADIHNYANTTQNKTVRTFSGRDFNGSGAVFLYGGLWLSTSAITSISINNVGPVAWNSGTTFALYGIKGA